MKAVVNFFQDNAMFYKDITQWLRNRTFGSLFFGLLLIAEALSLFIIAGSDDINEPGVAMFYTLFMVLIIYAMVIAYLGNSLTSREFVNRTFELYELSGMSLERMIGGKILSMLYQFFFAFFCLVPFMFFAYFLGGLDFLEMVVGVIVVGLAALPLYLVSLLMALAGRYKQVNLLTKIASMFAMLILVMFTIGWFFAGGNAMQEMVREFTDLLKAIIGGDMMRLLLVITFIATYVQVCLLLFYFCCNSISRETDSREIPIKVLTLTLMLSWICLYATGMATVGYTKGDASAIVIPIFLVLMSLSLLTYYNRVSVPPIVARRYRDAKGPRRWLYWVFQPGLAGSLRTLLLLIGLAAVTGTLAIFSSNVATAPAVPPGSPSGGFFAARSYYSAAFFTPGAPQEEWLTALSLLIQIPWFLALPHLLFVRAKNVRHNYVAQRSISLASWVILGSLVLIYCAWTSSNVFGGGYGNGSVSMGDVFMVTALSPLPSMAMLSSTESLVEALGMSIRYFSGFIGIVLISRYVAHMVKEERALALETEMPAQPAETAPPASEPGAVEQNLDEQKPVDPTPIGQAPENLDRETVQ